MNQHVYDQVIRMILSSGKAEYVCIITNIEISIDSFFVRPGDEQPGWAKPAVETKTGIDAENHVLIG